MQIDEVERKLREEPRRWLVTGAAGFIGSHLCERLLEWGQEVVGVDNLSTGHLSNVEDVKRRQAEVADRYQFVEADIRDTDAMMGAAEGVSHVLHQAAMASVPRSIKEPILHHGSNTEGFFRVLEVTRAVGCRSLVYASSSSVYGDHPTLPKDEPQVGMVLSPYAATKRCNELYAEAWAHVYDMQVIGLRYFNVFGPRQDPNGAYAAVIPKWISILRDGQRPTIYGDGETSRDFCPVENVVQANVLAAMARGERPDRVYNVALGGRTTLNELFQILRDGMAEAGAPCGDIEAIYDEFRPGDIRHSMASIERARAQLGYEPAMPLADGLRNTMKWFNARA